MSCPSCGAQNEPNRKFCGDCGERLAVLCAACASPNPAGARFCGECGGPLAAGAGTAIAQPRGAAPYVDANRARQAAVAERRIVSVLFADLVGFTTLAEGRDPEEVRELLSKYFEMASEVIDRYGGTVEKFIGDAVMAVWGAPTAHEDDAERAVRAALDLVDTVKQLGVGIRARCGVLTGEAAVTLGARGQGMVAGDLVNTAARLQSVAEPGMVLVGEPTMAATRGAIAYEPAGDQILKGKVAPVPAHWARRVVAERGGRGRDERLEAPFVGRDAELRLLKDLFHATSRERRVRLLSITGQAGIGKSRLAREFLKYVDGVVERTLWHEGRSPAYGQGITFWALGEMVRSRAGLRETDDHPTTRTRIAGMLAEHVPDDTERRRIEAALLALLGVAEAPSGGAPELFSAWRTFFERLSAHGTVALVFEDLQWADEGTLDFIEHVMEWSRNVPILIITLARPDLLERRTGWGAGKRAFLALDIQPLDEASMRELLAGLVPGLPEAAARSIVARADGIPLYAVETVRMLVSDGRLRERDEGGFEPTGELGELAVPGSLHALIAARLDGLDPADRTLVQEGAVLGQSFTAAALAAVSGVDPATAQARLDQLVRQDLIRQEVDPRSPERGQYAFVQALIREVAYSTLSLRDRRALHLAAAGYFESLEDDELAGALAAHYVAAYRSSSDGPEADALAAQARVALRGAAARAESLGAPLQAVTFLRQAVEVEPDEQEQATLLEQAAVAASDAARTDVALELVERASILRERGGTPSAKVRNAQLFGDALAAARRRDEALARLEAAWASNQDLDDEVALVELVTTLASLYFLVGDYTKAQSFADRGLAGAERLGLLATATDALVTKGNAAFNQGRIWEARALLTGARQLAEEAGIGAIVLRTTLMLASFIALDDPARSVRLQREALEVARRLGRRGIELTMLGNASEDARRTGEWDWAIEELTAAAQLDVDQASTYLTEASLAYFGLHRATTSSADLDRLDAALAGLEDKDVAAGALDLRGTEAMTRGDWAAAARFWRANADASDLNEPYALPKAGRAAILAGDVDLAVQVLGRLDGAGTRGRAMDADKQVIRAGLAALERNQAAARAGYRVAIGQFRDLGLVWDEGLASFEAFLVAGGADPEATAWAEAARGIFMRLGATRMLDLLDARAAQVASPA